MSFQSSGGPSEWGLRNRLNRSPRRLGCFQSSGGPSEWGLIYDTDRLLAFEVSNQVGAPASGAHAIEFAKAYLDSRFPIKWGPQRVGPTHHGN